MPTSNNEWLTVKEASKISGYNAEYLRRLMRENKIKYRKFSFLYQVDKKSLEDYLEQAESMADKRYTPKEKK